MNHTDMDIANIMTIYAMMGNDLDRDETNLMELLLSNRNDI